MTRLTWSNTAERLYETGLDRGVLYPKSTGSGTLNSQNFETVPRPGATGSYNFSTGGWGTLPTVTNFSSGGPSGGSGWYKRGTAVAVFTPASQAVLMLQQIANISGTVSGSLAVTNGQTFTASLWVRCSVAQSVQCLLVGLNSSGSGTVTGTGTNTVLTPNTWTRISATVTADASTVAIRVDIRAGTSSRVAWAIGNTLDFADVMIESGSVLHTFFDGGTAEDGLYTYSWAGTANASASNQMAKPSLAVPWNGLISVDEAGGDSATAYHIDGRPFLYLPKPKEFAATIKAYTYPDAFAAIMGMAEAANGLFLDSQMGEAFDLSYRTLIGSASKGTSEGYKIHLVYNATVAPFAPSYNTLSDTVNASEFSWDIQAVPMPVEGYRHTAHVVVDTRHMDAGMLATIENMIYGDATHVPELPTPQELLDLLTFNGAIIILDNGDGTWTAKGPSHNIYLIGNGVFEIDNAVATDNGDGTFTISSTP